MCNAFSFDVILVRSLSTFPSLGNLLRRCGQIKRRQSSFRCIYHPLSPICSVVTATKAIKYIETLLTIRPTRSQLHTRSTLLRALTQVSRMCYACVRWTLQMFPCVDLWAATMTTSAGIEHRELLHCHLVLNKYRCRGHKVILSEAPSVSKMPEIKLLLPLRCPNKNNRSLGLPCPKGNPLPALVSNGLDSLSSAMSTRCRFFNTRGDCRHFYYTPRLPHIQHSPG